MPLTDWVRWDSELIDIIFEKPLLHPNMSGYKISAIPKTKNYQVVGIAFDYALRILVSQWNSRLKPYGEWTAHPLVATHGIDHNRRRKLFIDGFYDKLRRCIDGEIALNTLLPDCLILAKLETIYRSGMPMLNNEIFYINDADMDDLKSLTDLVDKSRWIASNQLILNPTFGQSSIDIGGADADLIIDDTLIDIKTTQELKFRKEYFRQLIGYALLNFREHDKYNLKRVGLYFSRYGGLFTMDIPNMDDLLNIDSRMWPLIEDSIKEYRESY
jgi:hypothetical protein